MYATLNHWGNSLAIRFPKDIIKELSLKENDKLKINIEDSRIIIEPPKKEELTIDDLFAGYRGDYDPKEFCWEDDGPVGGEVW